MARSTQISKSFSARLGVCSYQSTTARQPMHHERRKPRPSSPPAIITAAIAIVAATTRGVPPADATSARDSRHGAGTPAASAGKTKTPCASTA